MDSKLQNDLKKLKANVTPFCQLSSQLKAVTRRGGFEINNR